MSKFVFIKHLEGNQMENPKFKESILNVDAVTSARTYKEGWVIINTDGLRGKAGELTHDFFIVQGSLESVKKLLEA